MVPKNKSSLKTVPNSKIKINKKSLMIPEFDYNGLSNEINTKEIDKQKNTKQEEKLIIKPKKK